jgi:hypothetical protein
MGVEEALSTESSLLLFGRWMWRSRMAGPPGIFSTATLSAGDVDHGGGESLDEWDGDVGHCQ